MSLASITLALFLSSGNVFPTDSVSSLKQQLHQFPDSLSLHQAYIKAVGLEAPSLIEDYTALAQAHPNSVVVPYAIGSAMASSYDYRAKEWLLRAVELNPKLADAWMKLSIDAERWGDEKLGSYYMGRAAEADPSSPDYAFYFASSHKHIDRQAYFSNMMHVANRFRDSERGAQALYWLANEEPITAKKMEIYELCKAKFAPGKFRWSASAMSDYFGILLKHDPDAALQLAEEMTASLSQSEGSSWQNQLSIARDVVAAKRSLAAGSPRLAMEHMLNPKPGRLYGMEETLALLTTETMMAAGEGKRAFDSLLNYHTKSPSRLALARLHAMGHALGYQASQVHSKILAKLQSVSEPATAFDLERYAGPERLRLAEDLNGQVVLVTYWFPGCGPCRGEFPHFEHVLSKFDRNQVAYVGINISPKEDPYVLPFMKSSGYSFIPVKDDPDKRGNLPARGAPTNYLIDGQGNILYKNFMIGANNEESLELMILQALELSGVSN